MAKGIVNNWFTVLEAKPRLALIIAAGIVLLSFYLYFEVKDISNELGVKVDEVQKQFSQLDSLSKEEFWLERLEKSKAILSDLEARLLPIQKEGVARINLTNIIKDIAAKSGLKTLSITAENPAAVKGAPDFRRFTVRLRARFTAESLETFAELLSKDERQFILDEINLTLIPFQSLDAKISAMMPLQEGTQRGPTRSKSRAGRVR